METENDTETASNAPTRDESGVDDRRLVRRCVTHHFACDCREARFRELLEDVMHQHSDPTMPEYNECDKEPCAWCEEAQSLIAHGHPDGKISATNAKH